MKKYLGLALLIIALLLVGNNFYQTRQFKARKVPSSSPAVNYSKAVDYSTTSPKTEKLMLAVVNVGGFGCPSCPVIAENALKDTKGVIDAKTTSTGEASRVLYDESIVTIDDLRKALGSYTIDKIISDEPSQKDKLD